MRFTILEKGVQEMSLRIMFVDYEKQREMEKRVLLCTLFILAIIIFILPGVGYASDGYSKGNLLDLFTTDAFSGNWEVFTKMNWIGKAMSWVISAFSLIGLFTVGMRVMLTMLYLSGKNFWDNVDEIKSAGKNQSMFGIKELFNSAYNAKYGTGLDAVISFIFSLFPNIKNYSEYSADAKHKYNYSDSDTMTTYLLKSAIPNIMIIFAFTMGFNGTLWQAYGTVVEAMGIVAQNFVDTNLGNLVDRAMNTGSSYQFAYNADGTKYGDFKQSVVKKVYTTLLKNTTDLSSDVKMTVGKAIDNYLSEPIDEMSAVAALQYKDAYGNTVMRYTASDGKYHYAEVSKVKYKWSNGFSIDGLKKIGTSEPTAANPSGSGDSVFKLSEAAGSISDAQARNLVYSVVVNRSKEYDNALSVPASLFGFSENDGYYVHIFITKKVNSDEHNYMTVKAGD